jgi:hypothetical protein
MSKPLNSVYFNRFKHTSMLMYSYPIRVYLYERKMSKKQLIKILSKDGLIYDYYLLCAVLEGRASSNFSLHYFTHLYSSLSLPIPTLQYLFDSFLRWEEIKQFKKEQLNISKIRRGLSPIP